MGVISETFDTTFTALIAIEEVTHSPSRVLGVPCACSCAGNRGRGTKGTLINPLELFFLLPQLCRKFGMQSSDRRPALG